MARKELGGWGGDSRGRADGLIQNEEQDDDRGKEGGREGRGTEDGVQWTSQSVRLIGQSGRGRR